MLSKLDLVDKCEGAQTFVGHQRSWSLTHNSVGISRSAGLSIFGFKDNYTILSLYKVQTKFGIA